MQFAINKQQIQQVNLSKKTNCASPQGECKLQTARKVMLLLVNNALEKTPQKGKTEEILKACVCNL